MTDFTRILNLTLHIIMLLPKHKCKKKKESLSGCHLFFCHIDLHSEYAFSSDCTKIVSHQTYIDCLLKKCKDYLLYFQKRLLTTFPGRAERRKRKKKPEAARRKSYPIRPMTSKLRHTGISATLSRRIDVSTTLFWRPTPAGMLLKKSQSPTAHDVLLTSMRRD